MMSVNIKITIFRDIMLFRLVDSRNVSHEPAAYILGDFFYSDNGRQQVPPKR
jgi:hypothetical protein